MKKFFNEPEMNISMFNVENVVTASGDITEPEKLTAKQKLEASGQLADVTNTIKVTF